MVLINVVGLEGLVIMTRPMEFSYFGYDLDSLVS